jgi:hypothetical protein
LIYGPSGNDAKLTLFETWEATAYGRSVWFPVAFFKGFGCCLFAAFSNASMSEKFCSLPAAHFVARIS